MKNYFQCKKIHLRLILTIFAIVISLPGFSWASAAGKFTLVKGNVDLLKSGAKAAIPVNVGDEVNVGDIVRTKSASRAQVVLADGSALNIAEKSRIEIKEFSFEAEKGIRSGILRNLRGRLRSVVSKYDTGGSSRFEVETPTAVAAVRGTDFMTIVGGLSLSTDIMVLEGTVSVRNIDPKIKRDVLVGKGLSTKVRKGEHPTAPRPFKSEEISSLVGEKGEKGSNDNNVSAGETTGDVQLPEFTTASDPAPDYSGSSTTVGVPLSSSSAEIPISETKPEVLKTPVTVNVKF